MTAFALSQTTEALRARLAQAVSPETVHVGPPLKDERGSTTVSLFLYNVQPNRDLRNVDRLTPPPAGAPPGALLPAVDALPVDLRYLVSVFRAPDRASSGDPTELDTLGKVMHALHAEPMLSGSLLPGQTVRLTLEPYSIDELDDIWGLFRDEPYRTSVVYLASPVFIEVNRVAGAPVEERVLKAGLSKNPQTFGVTRGEAA